MPTQTVTGMFPSRAEADRAVEALRTGLTLQPGAVHVVDQSASGSATETVSNEDHGFFGSIRSLFLPEEDTHAYAEGVSRGDVLVSATVEHEQATQAMDILEQYGAVDYDDREKDWRSSGWQGTSAAAATALGATGMGSSSVGSADMGSSRVGSASVGSATVGSATVGSARVGSASLGAAGLGTASVGSASVAGGVNEVIPLYEESINVGKRDVSHGRVKVRTYVTETPVSELIRLRQERVTIERRPVDRPVGAGEDVFRERVIEATETSEEAVVAKDIRVREEIALRKDVTTDERTITDKVRRTEVDIEDGLGVSSVRGAGSVTGSAGSSTVSGVTGVASPRAL